ncbi:MAG TPA: UPF0280 family protein [Candidatus Bathyarchaeia archaeon]|nr:UPF0280 family protein [Candidatus Bathyarchaeia archaeon]
MREKFQLKQTVVTIVADEQVHIEYAKQAIRTHRRDLEQFIALNPFFQFALEPLDSYVGVPPEIARRMLEASSSANVGPMAAVAGAIADLAVEAMIDEGASYAIVDNGGDIALSTDREVTVGIFSGESPFRDLAFRLGPESFVGVCTSSATIGPSISFGTADVACVVAKKACLADAAASALGNLSADPEKAFSAIKDIDGILGALLMVQDRLVTWGKLPTLVRASVDATCITHA